MAEVVKQQSTDKLTPLHFPDDALTEIFLRLPVRSLFLFRSVSKHWLSLIQNPNFIRIYNKLPVKRINTHYPMVIMRTLERNSESEHRKIVLTLFCDDETLAYKDDVALEVLSPSMAERGFGHEGKLHLLGPCNGLFCLTDTVDVVLFNPSTRECRKVPRSPLSRRNKDWYRSKAINYFARVGFGFDPVSKDYKVVRFHEKKELDRNFDENDDGDNIDIEDDDSDEDDGYPYAQILQNFLSAANRSAENDKQEFGSNSEEYGDDFDDVNSFDYSDDDDDYPHDRQMKVEIFGLSTNSWRELDRVIPASDMPGIRSHNLFFNNAFHWLGADYDDYVCAILVFDLDKEDFKEFMLPDRYSEYEEDICVYLSVLNKSLAMIVHKGCDYWETNVHFEIWVMKKYGVNKSWRNLYNISPDVGIRRSLSFSNNGEFLVENNDGNLVSFNLKTKATKELQVHGVRESLHAFRYRERLTFLD